MSSGTSNLRDVESYDDFYKTDEDPQMVSQPRRLDDITGVRSYIDAIDFGPLKDKLESEYGWSRDRLEFAERLYKNWLFLRRKHEGEPLPPSRDIDEFWHWHILDTRAYHRDTATIFGYYLHHFPYFGLRGKGDYDNLMRAWDNTQSRYLQEFGEEIYEYGDEDE